MSATPFENMTLEVIKKAVEAAGGVTPLYLYYEGFLMQQINKLKRSFQQRVGGDLEEKAAVNVCIRYAMKALSNVSVLKIFNREGLSFDCSSIYEVMRVIKAGISPERIELVSQEMTRAQLEMLKGVKGADKVLFVASSQ